MQALCNLASVVSSVVFHQRMAQSVSLGWETDVRDKLMNRKTRLIVVT